jgi:hypothetical protein
MFFSQDDGSIDFTPREMDLERLDDGPAKKKGKGQFSHIFNSNSNSSIGFGSFHSTKKPSRGASSSIDYGSETEFCLTKLSQDSNSNHSQISQDFHDRLSHMNVRGSQDNIYCEHSNASVGINNGNYMNAFNESSQMSYDGNFTSSFHLNSIPSTTSKSSSRLIPKHNKHHVKTDQSIQKNNRKHSFDEINNGTERQIDLTPPIQNHFLHTVKPENETYLSTYLGAQNQGRKVLKVFISAFIPPSRYLTGE